MVSESSPPPPPPPESAAGAGDEGDRPKDGDRPSQEPESRPPWIPPELEEKEAESRRVATAEQEEIAKTAAGTHVMDAVTAPGKRGRGALGSIPDRTSPRASRLSMDAGRPSRISRLRQTLLSILPPLPISRAAGPFFAIGLDVVALVGAVVWVWTTGRMPRGIMTALHLAPKTQGQVLPPPVESVEDAPVDENPFPVLNRGRAPMPGGVFYIPSSFIARSDGEYDLIIHFHGNTQLMIESYEAAEVNAVVAILNIGSGSGPYEDKFANAAAFAEVLERVQESMKERGLPHPKLRRIALVGWSAGYGAIIRILDHPADADRVDAVILLDGLHTSLRAGTHEVDGLKIQSVIPFARRAMTGEKFFLIDHSDIDPVDYLGVNKTTDYVLKQLGLERHPVSGTTPYPHLKAMDGILPTDQLVPLEKESEAGEGSFIVRGYQGTQAYHHVAHLVQLSTIALPDLMARWQ